MSSSANKVSLPEDEHRAWRKGLHDFPK